jgi:hypothetical protein
MSLPAGVMDELEPNDSSVPTQHSFNNNNNNNNINKRVFDTRKWFNEHH